MKKMNETDMKMFLNFSLCDYSVSLFRCTSFGDQLFLCVNIIYNFSFSLSSQLTQMVRYAVEY